MRSFFSYVKSGMKTRLFGRIISCAAVLCFVLSFIPVQAAVQTAEDMLSAGFNHYVGVNKYGRVYAAGDNSFGQCNTYGWNNVIKAAAGKYFSAALLSDGSVVTCGDENIDTSSWSGITDIAVGGGTGKSDRDGFMVGLKSDGSLIASGSDIDLSHIAGAKKIAAGGAHVLALLSDGTVAAAGNAVACTTSSWSGVTGVFAAGNLSVGLKNDGTLLYAGEAVMCPGDDANDPSYWKPSEWTDIKTLDIALDAHLRGVVVGVKNDGTVLTDAQDEAVGEDAAAAFKVGMLKNIKCVAINKSNKETGLLAETEDGVAVLCGSPVSIIETDDLKEEINGWNLLRRPIEKECAFPDIASGKDAVYLRLPSGRVMRFSDAVSEAEGFGETFGLSVNLQYDILSAADDGGKVHTNSTLLSETAESWDGIMKTLSGVVEGTKPFVGGIRWDGLVRLASSTTYVPFSLSEKNSGSVVKSYGARDFACGYLYTAALFPDGSAKVYVKNQFNDTCKLYKPVSEWTDIKKLCGGYNHIVGIKNDGSVVCAGKNSGNYDGWTDIVSAAAGYGYTVGLRSDGTCISSSEDIDVSSWKNIKAVYGGNKVCMGYTEDGGFVFAGKGTEKMQSAVKTLANAMMTDDLFICPVQSDETLSVIVETNRAEKGKVFAALFDENGVLCGVHADNFESSIFELPSSGAKNWKVFVWNESMEPIYAKEGFFYE